MKYICEACVFNEVLKNELRKNAIIGDCTYCDSTNVLTMDSSILTAFAGERLLSSLYSIEEATSFERDMFYQGSDEMAFSEIWEIVQYLEVGDEDFEEEIVEYAISNSHFETDLFVLDDGDHENNSYDAKWSSFIESTTHKHRFFNKEAKEFLDALFNLILDGDKIRDEVITKIDNSTKLYRARIANDKSIREQIVRDPSSQLGAVPVWLAGEQRMTPRGISALYCSLDRDTCFSEVRAITGDRVISGAFKSTKELKLLDLAKIHKLSQLELDPFDEEYSDFVHKSVFIKKLMFLMSKPASKNSPSTYLSTQIIFEYLSVTFGDKLSGLMFDSVQTDGKGKNIVLFPIFSSANSSSLNSQNVQSVSEHYIESGDSKFYFYSVKKNNTEPEVQKRHQENIEFVENSLVLSAIKAVITKTETCEILINIKSDDSGTL